MRLSHRERSARLLLRACFASSVLSLGIAVHAQEGSPSGSAGGPVRPAIMMNRWQEDWSPLADPALRDEPLDALKYLPLSANDPQQFVSFGATLRERFESTRVNPFGVGNGAYDDYLLQRLQVHADIRIDNTWQVFTQLEDVRAFKKEVVSPVDANRLDLRLAFVAYTHTAGDDTFKARIGRQDFAFDLQRFVSSRDGPNVRQSFDAAWADWETGTWRLLAFVSQPVQYADVRDFDDFSDRHFRFDTIRIERHVLGSNELSAYYSRYDRDNVHYLDAAGDERRDILDARFAGLQGALDWDLEGMGQGGTVGVKRVRAWAIGARGGYTLSNTAWKPRLGLQADAASGDHKAGDSTLGTFNPLFPNGYYFSLAGFTGYTNLVHLKPSITMRPIGPLTVLMAAGFQWRETTADAIYTQPNVPVSHTAGFGTAWSGAYAQLRADYAFNRNFAGALEAVYYKVGDTIRAAGGRDSTYLGVEVRLGL